MNKFSTTKIFAILAAIIISIMVAKFGYNTLSGSRAQANLEAAMREMANATTEKQYEKAAKKAEKAVQQGAVVDMGLGEWRKPSEPTGF